LVVGGGWVLVGGKAEMRKSWFKVEHKRVTGDAGEQKQG